MQEDHLLERLTAHAQSILQNFHRRGACITMFSPFFQDLSQAFMGGFDPQPQAAAAAQPKTVPPASRKFIDNLKELHVTADDLLEENNKECLVCLEEQKVGGLGVKLPCGHLYHRACVVDWLRRHCTCPCCRFEVESDDVEYEKERRMRMKKRKLRMRTDEISTKSLSQLRELCRSLQVSTVGCLDKTEIVDRLVKSGKIEITEGAPALEITRSDLMRKGVAELRHLLLSYGLSDEGALEKRELRARLEDSGRLVIVEDASEAVPLDAMGGYDTTSRESRGARDLSMGILNPEVADPMQESDNNKICQNDACNDNVDINSSEEAGAGAASVIHNSADSREAVSSENSITLCSSLLNSLPVRDIKNILSNSGIDASRCVERQDLVDLLRADLRFSIIDDS